MLNTLKRNTLRAIEISRIVINWPVDSLYCFSRGVRWDPSWRFLGRPYFYQKRRGSIRIGRRFVACSRNRDNSVGVFQRVTIRVNTREGRIEIGDDVGVSGAVLSARKRISIGNRVLIGSGVIIVDNDAHPLVYSERLTGGEECIVAEPVVVSDDVFVGARAIILKGVRIGRGAVVGAGAVVTKDVPEETIVAGNPAKVVGAVSTKAV